MQGAPRCTAVHRVGAAAGVGLLCSYIVRTGQAGAESREQFYRQHEGSGERAGLVHVVPPQALLSVVCGGLLVSPLAGGTTLRRPRQRYAAQSASF